MLAISDSGSPTIVGGIVNFMGMTDCVGQDGCRQSVDSESLALGLFHTIKQFSPDLQQSASAGGGLIVNFTAMDGAFGLREVSRASAAQAATIGLVKSFAREADRLTVRNIDLDPDALPEMLVSQILQELTAAATELETGIRSGMRVRLDIRQDPLSNDQLGNIDLDPQSVLLITGGARGITGRIAIALARETGGRFVLVGRSHLPADEPADLAPLADPAALRQHFIAMQRGPGQRSTPAEVEHRIREIQRDREIRSNLAAINAAANETVYRAVDVRNDVEFGGLIEEIYRRWGRIDAVIHGAGLIEDKLIRDKTSASFARVFATKVRSANTLVRCLRPESLKYLVFFTSVSGRFGNAGQSDYSAANEYLSKLARNLDAHWPGRVVAISWGPWDGGMVTDELRRLYRSRGIEPMPQQAGVDAFLNELRLHDGREPEVLLGSSIRQIAKLATNAKRL